MFTKTTKLMPEEEAIKKAQSIRALLGSGDGFVQVNEEDGKCFLFIKVNTDLKSKVLSILNSK